MRYGATLSLNNGQSAANRLKEKYSQQRFDFYLPSDGNPIAIEFNGEQHYRETDFFKGSLEVFQERDERKKKYCEENNITLITIPYWYSKEDIIKTINSISSTT